MEKCEPQCHPEDGKDRHMGIRTTVIGVLHAVCCSHTDFGVESSPHHQKVVIRSYRQGMLRLAIGDGDFGSI